MTDKTLDKLVWAIKYLREGQFLMAEERIRTLEAEIAVFQNENHRLLGRDLEREAEVARLRAEEQAARELLILLDSYHQCDGSTRLKKSERAIAAALRQAGKEERGATLVWAWEHGMLTSAQVDDIDRARAQEGK